MHAIKARSDSTDTTALFMRVVAPHLPDAESLARWLTGSGVDAKDVVQQASLRALRGVHGFANGDARSWVLTIVRHTAYDWLRRNRSGAVTFVDDLESMEHTQSIANDVATPETDFLELERTQLLEAAIRALPAQSRETLVLREVQGLSYRELAERLGLPIGTVMSRLHRARRQLFELTAQHRFQDASG